MKTFDQEDKQIILLELLKQFITPEIKSFKDAVDNAKGEILDSLDWEDMEDEEIHKSIDEYVLQPNVKSIITLLGNKLIDFTNT